ncbi:hypothetical protein GCM10010402_28210 [Actinomadura luteofluorescens]
MGVILVVGGVLGHPVLNRSPDHPSRANALRPGGGRGAFTVSGQEGSPVGGFGLVSVQPESRTAQ